MSARGDVPPSALARLRRASAELGAAHAEIREAVVAANRAGGSVRVIAAELRMSPVTIQSWLREAARARGAPR